jgi:hypothetical protein
MMRSASEVDFRSDGCDGSRTDAPLYKASPRANH